MGQVRLTSQVVFCFLWLRLLSLAARAGAGEGRACSPEGRLTGGIPHALFLSAELALSPTQRVQPAADPLSAAAGFERCAQRATPLQPVPVRVARRPGVVGWPGRRRRRGPHPSHLTPMHMHAFTGYLLWSDVRCPSCPWLSSLAASCSEFGRGLLVRERGPCSQRQLAPLILPRTCVPGCLCVHSLALSSPPPPWWRLTPLASAPQP